MMWRQCVSGRVVWIALWMCWGMSSAQAQQVELPGGATAAPESAAAVAPAAEITEAPGILTWRNAGQHIGQKATVQGTIVATHNSGKVCFLNFHENYRTYFSAVIFGSAFGDFPPQPEDHYYGKTVRVRGVIKKHKGAPEMILNSPDQIEVLSAEEAGPVGVVPWSDALRYVGRRVTLEGRIESTHCSAHSCFLSFDEDWKHSATLVINAGTLKKFPPHPDTYYAGQSILASGMVKLRKGRPEIVLTEPGQVQLQR